MLTPLHTYCIYFSSIVRFEYIGLAGVTTDSFLKLVNNPEKQQKLVELHIHADTTFADIDMDEEEEELDEGGQTDDLPEPDSERKNYLYGRLPLTALTRLKSLQKL